jgi:hypothetical protein
MGPEIRLLIGVTCCVGAPMLWLAPCTVLTGADRAAALTESWRHPADTQRLHRGAVLHRQVQVSVVMTRGALLAACRCF